jgi:photosystem II stability/assembly factor-like uncharacterized protein
MLRRAPIVLVLSLVTLFATALRAQADPRLFSALRWRMIGPFRGGRTVAGVGVPGQPGLFYIGVNNGGVWKTTDYGRVWTAIFDDQATGSIGAIAVAPSDPNTIYVGSGEGLQRPDLSVGDGIYKSLDAGRSWTHLGLRDGQQIAQLAVDPKDANRVFAAVIGHPYGPNNERGIYRSTDGGQNWTRVLFKDENTGGMDVVLDPGNAQTVFAVLWAARQAPWETGWTLSANCGLYKSTDGGTTWKQITSGLPSVAEGLGRIGLAVSASLPGRMFAVVGADKTGGVYRSDDGGESWRLANADPRLWGRDGDFNEVKVDPKNADVIYVANVVTWKSTDGGKTFAAFRGAPGGDDYHRFWISPDDSRIILIANDQGAIVTVNGGATWSSWYNQPTAQMFHVNTDNRFPYWVYGGQQESGSAGVKSRGDDGQITVRDWHTVGAEEYSYAVPDPLHPNLIYGGKLSRFDWNTGQVEDVSPEPVRSGKYRWIRTMPIVFSPVDPHILYLGSDVIFKTLDGGRTWTTISPDLTRDSSAVPASLGVFAALDPEKGKHRGVVYAIAPSFKRVNLIWAGTDDGQLWVTHNGGARWQNVTPATLTPWSKVAILEASHFDTLTAYAAINRLRLDDLHPHILRTKDGGKTWTEIVTGIPDNEMVDVVREDPARRGLLFAGSERSVYVSFDEGDHWQSLRLNLPASSMRDLAVHDNDLIVATHGRSFWILDDFAPLRETAAAAAAQGAYLYKPAVAYRVRWNANTDTPLPPDEPTALNPPDGTALDYYLPQAATGPMTLEIRSAAGALVRRFASTDVPEPPDSTANIPPYWIRPPQTLATAAGMHRFVWDLRYPDPEVLDHNYPIAAIYQYTPREPRGPFVVPGNYTVTLTAGDARSTQPLVVRMDPRVPVTAPALGQQLALANRLVAALHQDNQALQQIKALRLALQARHGQVGDGGDVLDSLAAAAGRLESGGGGGGGGGGRFGARAGTPPEESFTRLSRELAGLYDAAEGADVAPRPAVLAAAADLERSLATLERRWRALVEVNLVALNARLKQAGLSPIVP